MGLLGNRHLKLSGEEYMQMHGVTEGPLYDWFVNMMANVSIEDHARLRSLVNKAFTPRMVENLRPFIRLTSQRLAEQIVGGSDVCEFVGAFADPLASLVMCEMLGVPVEDYDRFHQWSNDMGLVFTRSRDELPRAEAAIVGLSEYVASLIARRRDNLGEDVISSLITTEQVGDRLTADELHNLVLFLVWAAQDTTAKQLGRGLVAFCEYPEQWALLAERPELAPQAVEEICRWSPMSRTTWRFATEDIEYHGLKIPARSMVIICTVVANRDPRAFEDPERFDITVTRQARHLVFGGGPYYCLGAGIARLEIAEALLVLTRRFGAPSVAGSITWRPPGAVVTGPDILPLRFGPLPRKGNQTPE